MPSTRSPAVVTQRAQSSEHSADLLHSSDGGPGSNRGRVKHQTCVRRRAGPRLRRNLQSRRRTGRRTSAESPPAPTLVETLIDQSSSRTRQQLADANLVDHQPPIRATPERSTQGGNRRWRKSRDLETGRPQANAEGAVKRTMPGSARAGHLATRPLSNTAPRYPDLHRPTRRRSPTDNSHAVGPAAHHPQGPNPPAKHRRRSTLEPPTRDRPRNQEARSNRARRPS